MSTFFTWVAIDAAADKYCERASASSKKKKIKDFCCIFLEGAVREGTICKGEIKEGLSSVWWEKVM